MLEVFQMTKLVQNYKKWCRLPGTTVNYTVKESNIWPQNVIDKSESQENCIIYNIKYIIINII